MCMRRTPAVSAVGRGRISTAEQGAHCCWVGVVCMAPGSSSMLANLQVCAWQQEIVALRRILQHCGQCAHNDAAPAQSS